MKAEGAIIDLISPIAIEVRSWSFGDWSKHYPVNVQLEDADPDKYDALVLPGGVINGDGLRTNKKAIAFVQDFFHKDKPVSAICHGAWILIDAKQVADRRLTTYYAIRSDMENAGANWVNKEVVVDKKLVTSRHQGDLPGFIDKTIETFHKYCIKDDYMKKAA